MPRARYPFARGRFVSARPRRQLLIGLDAMEWELVDRWVKEGKLPTFRRLMERGTRGELASTSAQLPDTVWTCLYTGVNPAKLEKWFYVQYDAATLGLKYRTDDAITRPPFWQLLGEGGRRVGIVDVPKTRLSPSLNGFQLTNWGAHATTTPRASVPAALVGEVESRFGDHPVRDCDAVAERPAALRKLRDRVLEGVRVHGRAFRALMKERAWDVFFAAFSAPHCIGHHLWHYMDSTHPRHVPGDPHGLADGIERVYAAIDREVGDMVAEAGDDTLCIVVAAHGMGPLYHASWSLPEILERLGYGEPVRERSPREAREARVNPWRILKMVVPGRIQYRIKAMLPETLQHRLLFLWYAGGKSWAGHRAFAIPNNDSVGAIRVSVKGRDRDGLVRPGAEYDEVCRDIAEALEELTDPVSGRRVVKLVTRTHREFEGPFLDDLPDLTVLWDQSFRWESVTSPRVGTLRIPRQDARGGSHRPRGFFLAVGPGVPAGAVVEGRSIYDIAPTVLEYAGVPIPADLDGRPLPLHAEATALRS